MKTTQNISRTEYLYSQYEAALENKDFIQMANATAEAILSISQMTDERFVHHSEGVCPACYEKCCELHLMSGLYAVCHKDKLKWAHPMESHCTSITEKEYQDNQKLLDTYTEVRPLFLLKQHSEEVIRPLDSDAPINADARDCAQTDNVAGENIDSGD